MGRVIRGKSPIILLISCLFGLFTIAVADEVSKRVEALLKEAGNAWIPEEKRVEIQKQIVGLGEKAVPSLIPHLGAMNILEVNVSMGALAGIGSPAAPYLIAAMRGDDPEVAYRAALTLGDIHDARVVPALLEGLKSSDWHLRTACAKSLGTQKNVEATIPLIAATADPEDAVRRAAAIALGHIGDPAAVDALAALLYDTYVVRYSAAIALASIGRPALPALEKSLQSGNPEVVIAALQAIGGIPCEESVHAVIPLLASGDWAVRGAAALALRRIGTPEANDTVAKIERREKHPFVLFEIYKPLPK